jgi:hypothetical protein
VKTPFRAPDANAHAERWVSSVTGECLDHLILFGMSSLQRALRIYRDFFNGHRPHHGIDNQVPEHRATGEMLRDRADGTPDEDLAVECEQFLGGLLNSYHWKAAQAALEALLRRVRWGPLHLRRAQSRAQGLWPSSVAWFQAG